MRLAAQHVCWLHSLDAFSPSLRSHQACDRPPGSGLGCGSGCDGAGVLISALSNPNTPFKLMLAVLGVQVVGAPYTLEGRQKLGLCVRLRQ
jgi:hypothetical protein